MTQADRAWKDGAFGADAEQIGENPDSFAPPSDLLMFPERPSDDFPAEGSQTEARATPEPNAEPGSMASLADQKAALALARTKRRRRHHVILGAMLGDIIVLTGAIGMASLALPDGRIMDVFVRVAGFMLPAYLLLALNGGAHGFGTLSRGSRSIRAALLALSLALACFVLSASFWKTGHTYSRLALGTSFVLGAAGLTFNRLVVLKWIKSYLGSTPLATVCIYDGVRPSPCHEKCALDAQAFGLMADSSNPDAIARLGEVTRKMDRIVVHCRPESRLRWSFMLKSLDVPSEIVIPELTALHPLEIEERAGEVSLVISTGQLAWHQRMIKRGFDLIFSSCALIVLAPFMLLVALAVRLESPGPALFRQDRIGLGNRKFKILKFRSMRSDMQDDKASKLTERNDPRVTRVGAFIRKTSIDELPQLINVLCGEMSIVGPRPHAEMALAGDSLYWEVDETYWHRHVVKPGITGLAQIRGHRGNTFHEDHLRNRLQADLEYASNWSLSHDIRIVLQTFGVLFDKNAF